MTTEASSGPALRSHPEIRVWDWPLRLTHWSFAGIVPVMWWSAENSQWSLHKTMGLVLIGLLVFRILWGFLGTRTSRFASFVRGPGAVLGYLRGTVPHRIGHNPLGALSVLALLSAMAVQAGTGLFAGDPFDGATGPLNPLVGVMTADAVTDWHTWFYWVVLGLAALHLTAIVYYAVVRQDDLVSPMVSGRKLVKDVVEETEAAPLGRFALSALIAAGLALWLAAGAPPLG